MFSCESGKCEIRRRLDNDAAQEVVPLHPRVPVATPAVIPQYGLPLLRNSGARRRRGEQLDTVLPIEHLKVGEARRFVEKNIPYAHF